jgi:hypothetical protein
MNDFYIFQYIDPNNFEKPESITIVFVNQRKYPKHKNLIDELEEFFQSHLLTDKLIIILPDYCDLQIQSYFDNDIFETFRRVPGFTNEYHLKSCFIYKFDKSGEFIPFLKVGLKKLLESDEKVFFNLLMRNGATQIFIMRGGLVESTPDHHFVFPSNKHSEKFLRTGNILINSAEIFFLAIQLLERFNNATSIYCDTSSINVIPFAIFEVKRRFGVDFNSVPINSFESYTVFEKSNSSFQRESLIIVSSSTSGKIIERLVDKKLATKDQIVVLFFLGENGNYLKHQESIMCNLTKDANEFPNGLSVFDTYANNIKCKLCENFSRPIDINSDVFLTVQPKVHSIILKKTDAPKYLSAFMQRHRANNEDENIFKTYYRHQNNDDIGNYEVFIDTLRLVNSLKESSSSNYKNKFNRKLNTFIPANTKYLIYLNDEGSKEMADYIYEKLNFKTPIEKFSLEQIDHIKNKFGSIVIIGSCIVTGRHYLHLSRILREYPKLSILYFINIFRTNSEDYATTTKNNLSQGIDGSQTFPVVSIEDIYCTSRKGNTNWDFEKIFFETLISDIDEDQNKELASYVKSRIEVLRNNKKTKGLVNNVFLNRYDGSSLYLRKGFVFWDFKVEEKLAYQSQVYFTISSVLNNLCNNPINSERTLRQSNYVRNLISPDNFQRFNDGIIQASILRAGKKECFAYDLDSDCSLKMKALLKSMIDNYDNSHGEALLEFLLAIGTKKLRLKKKNLKNVLKYASRVDDPIIKQFSNYLLPLVLSRT